MAEDTERPITIPVGVWNRDNVAPLLWWLLIPATIWLVLMLWPGLHWRLVGLLTALPAVAVVVIRHHRDDRIEFDAAELRHISQRQTHRFPWQALDEAWIETNGDQSIRLRAGDQRCTIPLRRIESVDTARRLRACLAPVWDRKLAAMAAGEVPLPPPAAHHPGYFVLGILLGLAIVVAGLSSTGTDRLIGTGLGGLWILLAAHVLLFVRYAAGPDQLTIGGNAIALADIESIKVMRYPMGEFWRLRSGRRTLQLYRVVDFPLVCEHILRRCPGVSFTYDVRRPRSAVEQVFLPCPPGSEGLWSAGN